MPQKKLIMTNSKVSHIVDAITKADIKQSKYNGYRLQYTIKREYSLGMITELDALHKILSIVGTLSFPTEVYSNPYLTIEQYTKCVREYLK